MSRVALRPSDILKSLSTWPAHLRKEIFYKRTPRGQPGGIEVTSYRALVRVVGYHWYRNQNSVLLRGQNSCYGSLEASAFRARDASRLRRHLDAFLDDFRARSGYDATPEQRLSTEPLLQHYGIRTRWLDLVDSIPHALFFATHRLARSPFRPNTYTYLPSPGGQGLLYIVDVGALRSYAFARQRAAGLFRTDWGGLVCDLRRAKPGLALRPHAQHGWLVRAPALQPDLWHRTLTRVYFDVRLALSWLQGAGSLEREALLPHPSWDEMYRSLLSPRISTIFDDHRAAGFDIGEITTYDFHSAA